MKLEEPTDYFKGIGQTELPTPTNILLFLRLSREKLQQKALQNRSHHRYVLLFNLQTEGYVHVNNLLLPFHPGQALLILPYQFHHFSQLAASHLKWLICTFELAPRTFLEPLRNRVIDLGPRTRKMRTELLTQWHRCQDVDNRGEIQFQQLQATVMQLLLSLKEDRQSSSSDLPVEPQDNLLRSVNRLMSEWRGRTVIVADLAEALEYSESRLRNLFKETAGIPLGRYIQNYRINRAMALLRSSDLSIADIAEEAGFGSPQAFSRIFRTASGMPPRTYRKGR